MHCVAVENSWREVCVCYLFVKCHSVSVSPPQTRSLGERIVLYILNRIVYRVGEMDKPEVPFLCHGQHDFAKLLWKDGNAVGFYSVKPKGERSLSGQTVKVLFKPKPLLFDR